MVDLFLRMCWIYFQRIWWCYFQHHRGASFRGCVALFPAAEVDLLDVVDLFPVVPHLVQPTVDEWLVVGRGSLVRGQNWGQAGGWATVRALVVV